MRFSRQEYWSGLPCPLPGDLPNSGTEPTSVMSPALAGGFFTTSTTWEAPSGWFSVLSLWRVWVQSLASKLRSCKLHCMAKPTNENKPKIQPLPKIKSVLTNAALCPASRCFTDTLDAVPNLQFVMEHWAARSPRHRKILRPSLYVEVIFL